MLRTNPHYARMGKSYLFAEIARSEERRVGKECAA